MKNRDQILILFLAVLIISGCGKQPGFHVENIPTESLQSKDLEPAQSKDSPAIEENELPDFEDSDVILPLPFPNTDSVLPKNQEGGSSQNQNSNQGHTQSNQQNETGTKKEVVETPAKKIPDIEAQNQEPYDVWNSLVDVGRWVIMYEARKVGPACNFYIQRVFQLLGFGRGSWLANDFDRYVKDNFKSYTKEAFKINSRVNDQNRLKSYLMKFPEKKGVVLQWERNRGPGHVAILHRIRNEFVIFHASLNKFNAKAQKADIPNILYRSGTDYTLYVYSDMKIKN